MLQLSFSRAKIMCYQGSKSPTQYKRRKQTWQKENYHQPKYTIALVWHFFLLCSVFPFCTRQGFLFLLRFFHLVFPNRPIGYSEYGAEGMPNLHSRRPRRGDHTEEYQAKYHEYMVRCFARFPWIWATHVWNMFDFAADA